MNAYSGLSGAGHASALALLIKYLAERISIGDSGVLLLYMQTDREQSPVKPVLPDASSKLSKKEQVAEMFNGISGKYDFLNHFLSMGIDRRWRKRAIAEIAKVQPTKVLDVATGTGDLAIAAAELRPGQIIGVDIAEQMLAVGREKIEKKGLSDLITLQYGDSEHLPFDTAAFDAVVCAYGVRNFENLDQGLAEMCRVMRPGGRLAILEFSHPQRFPMRQLYRFYFRHILPLLGKLVSRHSRAYTYLPESVQAFPQGAALCRRLEQAGFRNPHARPLTFGITTLYTAGK
jgi:demethylmenaquinone methyltransferase/2-methoxy-6-polyprenyl-1,4-benzoquinol methylase